MAIDDDMTEGEDCVSSLGLSSVAFRQGGTMLSPEDVAWVDSCLTKDPELLGSGWDSLKDALLETLSSQNDLAAHEKDYFLEDDKMEIFSSSEGTRDLHNIDKAPMNIAANTKGAEPSSGDGLNQESTDDFWSRHNLNNVFLPRYNEHLRDLGTSDPEVDLVLQAFESKQSTDDIFKIWDLGIPLEEDDFIKQLNKALADSSFEPTTSTSNDFKDVPLDDLISGIADLSLSSNPI